MSGWAVTTIRTRKEGEYNDEQGNEPVPSEWVEPQKAVAREALSRHDSVGVSKGREVYVWGVGWPTFSDHRDMPPIVGETTEYWDKVVFIRANDTSDTGTARLYEQRDGEIVKTDEYAEGQYEDGVFVGRLAAAYMLVEHHVEALADFFDKPWKQPESVEEVEGLW